MQASRDSQLRSIDNKLYTILLQGQEILIREKLEGPALRKISNRNSPNSDLRWSRMLQVLVVFKVSKL